MATALSKGVGAALGKAVGEAKILTMPKTLIFGRQLKEITNTLSLDRCVEMATLINKKCAEYGVTTLDEFDEFLANIIQESGEFRHKSEDMSYSAKRMAQIWPKNFAKKVKNKQGKIVLVPNDLAYSLEHKPKELANYQYGSRYGNRKGTDDGWNLRGGGYIGLTFYAVWAPYAKFKNKTVEEVADLVRNSDEWALDSAFWFFYVMKDLKQMAIDDNFIGIVKSINGGTIGIDTRKKYYTRIQKVLGIAA